MVWYWVHIDVKYSFDKYWFITIYTKIVKCKVINNKIMNIQIAIGSNNNDDEYRYDIITYLIIL